MEALTRVGIPDAARRLRQYPYQFSGGMRQRALIAMAIACRPRLLVADEPTTALDVTVQAQIVALLKTLKQELGLALLFITHNLDLMSQVCDRSVVLYGGMVMEEAPVAPLFTDPRHPYTAALLRCVPRLSDPPGILDTIEGAPPVAGTLGPGLPVRAALRRSDRPLPPRPPGGAPPGGAARGLLGAGAVTPLLQLSGVTKVFPLRTGALPRLLGRQRHLTAVRDVTLAVPAGTALGIVGESGCGKSTLARIIMRLETPTAGSVHFAGEDLATLSGDRLRASYRRMQMVFQDPGGSLNPRKPVRRVLRESLLLAGVAAAELQAEAAGLLGRVGLSASVLDRYPHELSGGQRQRVAIARALAMKPELIVADEPVSALDVSLQAQIIRLLMQLRDELRLTLVFISHDLALVHHLCSAVAVMQAGQIVEQGTPADVLHHPQHAYTRLLLRAVPQPRRA